MLRIGVDAPEGSHVAVAVDDAGQVCGQWTGPNASMTFFELAWGAYGNRSTVKTHIWQLREKIEEDPAQPRYIVTVWGVGYRFEGMRR